MTFPSIFLEYITAFVAGVMVSFTPCVYPVLPVVTGCIARANIQGSKFRGFILSCIYVLGLAITYCVLGVIAALTGKVFGHLQNNPWVFLVISIFLFLFGLMMIDILPFDLASSDLKKKIQPKGVFTILFFGMISGLALGPCTAPVLGTLLLYVGSRQNLGHAISLLFIFSYGVGFSLILAGTFSGFLSRLPRSGQWLVRIKQFTAAVLFASSGYFAFKFVISFRSVF